MLWQKVGKPSAIRQREMLGLHSNGEGLRSRSAAARQPVCRARQRLLGRDHDFRITHLLLRLFRVSPVRKKNGAGSRYDQNARAAGKPAQVPDVGQMRNKEMIEAMLRQFIARSLQACAVVHHFEFTNAAERTWMRGSVGRECR